MPTMRLNRVLTLSRPRFWLYEAGTFAVGAAAAIAQGGGVWSWLLPVWFLYFLVPANVLIYGVNDVYDYETDRRNPKKQGYEQLLAPRDHRTVLGYAGAAGALGVLLAALSPRATWLPLAIFLLCATFYSAPPIRAKGRPLIDALFSAGHYVATGWVGYAAALGSGVPAAGLVAGMLWAAAMHAYSAVPDIAADRASSLDTVATLLGQRRTVLLCAALYAGAAAVGSTVLGWLALALAVPYLVLMARSVRAENERLMALYRAFPALNAAVGAAVWWAAVLLR